MDTEWAVNEIDTFLALTKQVGYPRTGGVVAVGTRNAGSEDDVTAAAQVVEKIVDRVLPNWRAIVPTRQGKRWAQLMEAARRARTEIVREAEIAEKLGDAAPRLNAGDLHEWAWGGAQSLWTSGHYREAVRAAATTVNARTQTKVGRRDVAETALFNEVFSLDAPTQDRPRLRVFPDDGSQTYKSMHRGVRAFAEGCYAAIRNPLSHESDAAALSEQVASEQLAALSVLARWVDAAELHVAEALDRETTENLAG